MKQLLVMIGINPWINKDIKGLSHEKNQAHIVKIKTTHSLFICSNFFNQS